MGRAFWSAAIAAAFTFFFSGLEDLGAGAVFFVFATVVVLVLSTIKGEIRVWFKDYVRKNKK